jgi:hypothetical protein
MIIDQFREYSASAEYLRIRARREQEAALKSPDTVKAITGLRRAHRMVIKAFELENKERRVVR